jgi:hypothetical protein
MAEAGDSRPAAAVEDASPVGRLDEDPLTADCDGHGGRRGALEDVG